MHIQKIPIIITYTIFIADKFTCGIRKSTYILLYIDLVPLVMRNGGYL